MDVQDFINLLNEQVGDPPIWKPSSENQQGQFDLWKQWSVKKDMIHQLEAFVRSQKSE